MSYGYWLLSLETPKARKEYTCQWCYTNIAIGEVYTKHNYIYDGFTSEKFHSDCYQAMQNTDNNATNDDSRCMDRHKRGEVCDGHTAEGEG